MSQALWLISQLLISVAQIYLQGHWKPPTLSREELSSPNGPWLVYIVAGPPVSDEWGQHRERTLFQCSCLHKKLGLSERRIDIFPRWERCPGAAVIPGTPALFLYARISVIYIDLHHIVTTLPQLVWLGWNAFQLTILQYSWFELVKLVKLHKAWLRIVIRLLFSMTPLFSEMYLAILCVCVYNNCYCTQYSLFLQYRHSYVYLYVLP